MNSGDVFQRQAALPLMPEAVEIWRQNIRRDTYANYHFEMAIALQRERSTVAAADAFRRALAVKSDMFESHVALADLLAAAGQSTDAMQIRKAAAVIDPAYEAIGCVRLGLLEAREQRPAGMREWGKRALAAKPDYIAAELLLWLADLLDGKLAELPRGAREARTEIAALATEAGSLGLGMVKERNLDLAELLFRFSLMHEENPVYLRYVGSACQQRFDLTEAAAYFARAHALKPDDVEIALNIVRTEIVGDCPEDAAAALSVLERKQGGNLMVNLHQCLLSLVRHRPFDAFEQSAAAIGKHGEHGALLSIQALALIELNDAAKAELLMRQALVASPDHILCLLDVSMGLRRIGHLDMAEEVRKRVFAHPRGSLAPFLAATRRWVGVEVLRAYNVPENILPKAP